MKYLTKSGLKKYYCPECKYTFIVERDELISEWYVWRHGRLILKSARTPAEDAYWMRALKYLKKNRKI